MISVAATGFFTAFSLILAIGAQNAFVLRQGLSRQYIFVVCLICAVSDAILIAFGVAGFAWIVTLNPNFPTYMAIAGAVFLGFYALHRFWVAWQCDYATDISGDQQDSLWKIVLICLGLTWLNPHVYLDTLGLIGAVSSQYDTSIEKLVFALAAVTSSFVFFFGLGYGARYLAPIMQSNRAWQIFDVGVGIIMLLIAAGLIGSVL